MSETGEGDMTLGGPDSPMGMAGAWARAAGAGDGVGSESGPHGAAGVQGAAGGLGEAAGEQAAAAAEGGSAGEDSDIGPAEEGEEEAGRDVVVDAHLFPMANFRLMFLDLVRSLLHRVYYNDHVLVRPRAGRLLIGRPRPRAPDGAAELHAPQPPPEGAAAPAPAEEATREPAEEATREPAEEAAAPAETTKCRYENANEEAEDAESKEEKEKFNRKQEGPEKDLDPAESTLRKSSCEE